MEDVRPPTEKEQKQPLSTTNVHWLHHVWEDVDPSAVGRPRRRYYELTPEGLLLRTAGVAHELEGETDVGSAETYQVPEAIKRFTAIGRVPLVTTAEFNLGSRSNGRFAPQHRGDADASGDVSR